MNTRISNRIVSLLLCLVMLVGMVPTTVMAEHTPIAPAVDSTTTEYSVPSGSTLTLETYEYGFDSNYGLGKDYLFVIKNGTVKAINLDFVIRIREFPKNKKGKKKSVVLD